MWAVALLMSTLYDIKHKIAIQIFYFPLYAVIAFPV